MYRAEVYRFAIACVMVTRFSSCASCAICDSPKQSKSPPKILSKNIARTFLYPLSCFLIAPNCSLCAVISSISEYF